MSDVTTTDLYEVTMPLSHLREDTRAAATCSLDGGDLESPARQARAVLDGAGLSDVAITAGGGLDEYEVSRLVRAGAPLDVYAVGTQVGVAPNAPYLDAAYKRVEYDARPVMKLSSAKATAPGRKQVFRHVGRPDVIALCGEEPPDSARPLLRTVPQDGRRTGPADRWQDARERFRTDFAGLPEPACPIHDPFSGQAVPVPGFSAPAERAR
ncbi:hypothetical protein [Streptomyces broussonetiae]|uniref:hypothetical protein n=1 Tax=Streptomyces broussonetiae TaxID=2686304 RepID=UPI0035DADA45